ncbi:MAG: AMP-binding protein [Gammaproteobacteria bacterium]|nr:AMP-binding protein [Gammaproteobacteria bacterium]
MKPTLANLLAHHARRCPERVAFRFDRCFDRCFDGDFAARDITFTQLQAEANRLANAWLDAGLAPGDKVATLLPNSFELVAAFWAASVSGIVIVPCSTLLQENAVAQLLRDSESQCVIAHASQAAVLDSMRGKSNGDRGDKSDNSDNNDIAQQIGDRFILTEIPPSSEPPPGFQTYSQFTADASTATPATNAAIDGDSIYNIMYSSGTTGAPKGIVHSHAVRAMYGALFANAWRMTPESVVLHAGALVFNGAMLSFMPWLYLGCKFILHARFDAEKFIDAIAVNRVTHIVLVPAQIIALLNSAAFAPAKLESLQMLCAVGAPLHLTYKQRLIEQLPGRFYELYGVTEGFMTILDNADAPRKLESVGCAAAFTDIRIVDEHDEACAPGVIGEICGRGPLLMQGYYRRPDATAAAMRGDWLHSGDLGTMDADGFVYLVDRKKDMFTSGGVNVYPRDIEEVVARHPGVDEVAVFGTADAKWGEAAVAAVTGARDLDADELVEWVNQRVDAKFQRIKAAWILDAFPRNAAGKILKRELRARYCDGDGGDDNANE